MKNRTPAPLVPADVLGSKRPRRAAARSAGEVASTLSPAERERLRAALHDGLGQLLTSISFLASSLQQKLTNKDLPEAMEATEILSLTSRAISETQSLVRE